MFFILLIAANLPAAELSDSADQVVLGGKPIQELISEDLRRLRLDLRSLQEEVEINRGDTEEPILVRIANNPLVPPNEKIARKRSKSLAHTPAPASVPQWPRAVSEGPSPGGQRSMLKKIVPQLFRRKKKSSPNEARYRARFYNYGGALDRFTPFQRQKAYAEKIAEIRSLKNRQNVNEYFRLTEKLQDILLYFRKITNQAWGEHLAAYGQVDLSFLNPDLEKAMSPEDSQEGYLLFLQTTIRPMIENTPPEVAQFFKQMATALKPVLSAEEIEGFDHRDFAMGSFILTVVSPLLRDFRVSSVQYSSEEILKYENKEIKIILDNSVLFEKPMPEGADLTAALVEGVFQEMNLHSQDRVDQARSPQRKHLEAALVKLLVKSFKAPSAFDTADYSRPIISFYPLLSGGPSGGASESLTKLKNELRKCFFDIAKRG